MSPKVSVLIPAFNHEKLVEQTLQSIIEQDYPNVEIIIIDDCSTDRTAEVIERFVTGCSTKFIFRRNETNLGTARTLNTAFSLADGKYLALFASDDLFLPGRLSRQVAFMESHPETRILFSNGWAESLDGHRKLLHRELISNLFAMQPKEILRYLYTHKSPIFLQTALLRSDFMHELGGYDEDLLADDWLLNTRIFQTLKGRSQFSYLNEPVILYKNHGGNVHQDFERQSQLKLQFIDRHTPENLRREAFINIHEDIARTALSQGLGKKARLYAWKALAMSRKKAALKLLFKSLIRR